MNNRPPIIWRLQEPPRSVEEHRDYSSCEGYGKMVTVLDHVDRPSAQPQYAFDKMERVLINNAKEGDYILWAGGDPMTLILAGVVLANLELTDEVYWLRWDRRTDPDGNRTPFGYYTPVRFSLIPTGAAL